jgi:hypothetical protein
MTAAAPRRNVLLVVNETIAGHAPHDVICDPRGAHVLVVAPAVNTRLRHWMSDEDAARREAAARLAATVAPLRAACAHVEARVGDADPLRAIADALAVFAADELLIATPPAHARNWLARDIIARARSRFDLPVGEIVLDGGESPHRVLMPMRPRHGGLLTVGSAGADCSIDRPDVRRRHQPQAASAGRPWRLLRGL